MKRYLEELMQRYPILLSSQEDIYQSYQILEKCYHNGGKLLIAGNGGSAADAEHIVGELMKSFSKARELDSDFVISLQNINEKMGAELANKLQNSLPAIVLGNHIALNTAFANDVDGKMCFAQQVAGYGREADVFWAITTSGNSQNIIYAAITAKAKGMKVIGLTGSMEGMLTKYADVIIKANEQETYKIQELHLPIYHCICLMLEEHFFA